MAVQVTAEQNAVLMSDFIDHVLDLVLMRLSLPVALAKIGADTSGKAGNIKVLMALCCI